MRTYEEGDRVTQVFDSVADLLSEVQKLNPRDAFVLNKLRERMDPSWFGGLKSLDALWGLARNGWEERAEETMRVAESVTAEVDREYDLPTWHSRYDVAGSDVDVARFLSGEPENMITFDLVPTPTAGRVIAIAVNLAASSGASAGALIARGQAVVALVATLESIGLRTEVYVDAWHGSSGFGPEVGRQLVTVKNAGDTLDVASLMVALAHPAFYRAMILGVHHRYPQRWQGPLGVGHSHGSVIEAVDQALLPEGTITVDAKLRLGTDPMSGRGARGFVIQHLKDLGLIAE